MSRTLLDNDAIQNTSIKFEKLNEDITSILNKIKDLTFSTAINSSSTDTEFPSSKAVYTSVNTLSTSINNLNSNISSLNTSLDELKAKVDTNTNNISSNSNSISTINSQIQQINSNISSLSSSITELNTNLDTKFNTCQNDINTVSESLSTYITTHTEEFNTLTTRVNTLGENIASLQVKVTDINNAITTLEPYIVTPTYTPVSTEDSFNYTLTNINFSEIHAALVKGKDIKITGVLGDTLIPTTLSYTEDYISITSSGSYSLPFYYIFSIHKNDTSTLNIQQVVTNSLIANTPDNPSSYSDVQVASPLLVDSYNQFLITITSMTLNLVSGYSNVNSGSCTLDKNYTEIKKAIDFHLQIYIKNTNGNILKVVSQYCNTTVKVISLVYYSNQASFIINIGNSSIEPSITSYTIPSVDINIEETSDNPISNKAVYNALKEVKNTVPTNYVTTDTEQIITGTKNFGDFIHVGLDISNSTYRTFLTNYDSTNKTGFNLYSKDESSVIANTLVLKGSYSNKFLTLTDDVYYTESGNIRYKILSGYNSIGNGISTRYNSNTQVYYIEAINYYPTKGVNLLVRLKTAISSATSTIYLNINNTGNKPLYLNGTITSSTNCNLPAGTYNCYYDGANYYINTDGCVRLIADNTPKITTEGLKDYPILIYLLTTNQQAAFAISYDEDVDLTHIYTNNLDLEAELGNMELYAAEKVNIIGENGITLNPGVEDVTINGLKVATEYDINQLKSKIEALEARITELETAISSITINQ